MNFEKRLKQHITKKLDQQVPNPYKRKRFPLWAKIMIPVTAVTAAVAVPIIIMNSQNMMEMLINQISGSTIDMNGVAGFGIGNTPSKDGKTKMKMMRYLDNDDGEGDEPGDTSSWTDEQRELYDWESDYDWDPDKANVLFTLDENGKVTEVIYERTNGRGQVRQERIGNAAAMFVSKSFTYVMYVNDDEWDFYKDIDYAQELRQPTGFHVSHHYRQTIVIHNKTGKIFALKDLLTKLTEVTGVKQYGMQADPTRDDFIHVDPPYGNLEQMKSRFFKVRYDEETENIVYEDVLEDVGFKRRHTAEEDKYGQIYALVDDEGYDQTERLGKNLEIVELSNYTKFEKKLFTRKTNSLFYGNDERVYAFQNGKLNVFGEDFSLSPIEPDTVVNFEGLANEFYATINDTGWLNGSIFHYEEGYLYSAFGEVWQVAIDGTLTQLDDLEGNFVHWTNDSFMIGGQLIAFIDTEDVLHYSINGRFVQLKFSLKDGVPTCEAKHIINASAYQSYGHRIVIDQDTNGGFGGGFAKYYLIMVIDGKACAQYIAYGSNGGMLGVAGTISEPVNLTVD